MASNEPEICVYCNRPILELPLYDGTPLHGACIAAWCTQEKTKLIIDFVRVDENYEKVKGQEKFTRNLLVGSFFKNMVSTILYSAGYEVYPFGYESFLASVKRPFYGAGAVNNETAERIRSIPDLVVLDKERGAANFVEVKFRSRLWNDRLADISVDLYRKYWSESIIVLVCPRGKIFYAQFVRNLTRENNLFPVAEDFLPLEDVFERISWGQPLRKGFYANLVRTVSEAL